jgi:hypothetical protein
MEMSWLFVFKGRNTMQPELKTEGSFLEAPASWNTKYVNPQGFVCQITLRGETGKDLLEKANVAISFLLEQGNHPCENNNNHNGKETKLCPIHQCEMKHREKDGKSWFSHRLETGDWCYGKERKNGGSHE